MTTEVILPALPRVAVCGISLEASTFSPALTTAAMLAPLRGREVLDAWDFWRAGGSLADRAEWVGILQARSIAGGAIPAEDYAQLKGEILAGLVATIEERPLDGLVLDIHGAASVVGMDDMEGDLAVAVRAVVGPDCLISSGMDLHGNVSRTLAETVDLLTTYRTAPHVDWHETKERAARNLVDRLALPAGRRRPAKAWVPVPILLPGEMTSTRQEPATSLYARVPGIEALDGILDAGIWIGYPWADEPRNHAVVMAVGDDADLALAEATGLARELWERREEFGFVAPTGSLEEVLAAAVASPVAPYFVSDSGDNPTAGGAGDVTWTLAELLASQELLASGKRAIYASIPDHAGALAAAEAGVGADVRLTLGARVDARPAPPVEVSGRVVAVVPGEDNLEVVVRTPAVDVVVTRRRRPYHLESDFTRLGLDPRRADVVVVKIGYLEPELFDMAADWMLALTPGGVDQHLARLGHERIRRPMFPLDDVSGVDPVAGAVLFPGDTASSA
ncbi:microcystin degradation protein MlrC [Nocardioides cavernae]|uniref:Microcystin degradation protein MlrC n=1 Tax=Nocardioides cavernae TaxID=1921566 RepID=A0A7Y9H160_9ACTN|nr:M81 family metallopeptidase [Nocardioides cavernae]NYE35910.1 microcystin degradation protein MlrC [Nocardioides cavernae]